ncbi:hypothetical protein Aau02nite_60140 [Amorphoplanes auranticolor]|uniref:Uncharacterized protein n=2 Tax=Actinoplanes auranticolor TaxID=47988 RepID=A0A919SMQ4_9ACTN|nr:hypothetical protein Aau02nite_60140 [Actinoplanes auranticolor]
MILMGVLAICAVSGALLTYRPGWTRGPDEPAGSYTPPPPPVPSPAPAATAPALPPATTVAPGKPSQPVFSVAPPAPVAAAPVAASPARRSRNNGFDRFAPRAARTRA